MWSFAKIRNSNFYKISTSWFYTSISTGFRVIEIPFIISFISASNNADTDLSIFGIVLSIIVASSGLILSFATPTSCGENPTRLKKTVLYMIVIAYIVSLLLFILLVFLNQEIFLDINIVVLTILTLLAIIFVAIRRVYQGALIYIDRSWGILASSIMRVVVTIGLSIGLPKMVSSIFVALYILIFGAFIDTCMNIIIYYIYKKRMEISYNNTDYIYIKNYMRIAVSLAVYTVQNYIISALLTIIFDAPLFNNWIIVYSFISIFLGLYVDIENITAKYSITLSQSYQILVLPFIIGAVVFVMLYLVEKGRDVYFITFQGATNLHGIITVQWLIALIIIVFLLKQFFKGVLIYKNRNKAIHVSAYANILGLMIAGIVIYISTPQLITAATIVYLFGLMFEMIYIVSKTN